MPAAFDGHALGPVWALPFVGLLASIAILPLAAEKLWQRHTGKIALFWAAAFIIPALICFGATSGLQLALHTLFLDYGPFILLLLALYAVAGGIEITGIPPASPLVNTGLLAAGTVMAGFMGTTGASMLLIRPLIRANQERALNAHVVIFFIFLVSNIGGAWTPLGDPPLFLGFLNGVSFFWPLQHIPFVAILYLLLIFFALDSYLYQADQKQKEERKPPQPVRHWKLRVEGWQNIALLLGVIGAVILSGLWHPDVKFSLFGLEIELQNAALDVALLVIIGLSQRFTPAKIRQDNSFSWEPMHEVAKLFAAIFVTLIPVIAMLKAGADGAFAPIVHLLTSTDNHPVNPAYFWLTGGFSSFVDNAPTYLVFFNIAGGNARELTGPLATTLAAISAGAVFMGANSYIGNAPNFMVKSLAESQGVKMPSFFAYMLWSGVILTPCFLLITWIFFT